MLRRYVHGPGVDEPIVWYEGANLADPRYLFAYRASLRDASDNRSAYVYAGFDRLCRLYVPVATLDANAANAGGISESALSCSSAGTDPTMRGEAT